MESTLMASTRKRALELDPELDDASNMQLSKKPMDVDTLSPTPTSVNSDLRIETKATTVMRNELIVAKIAASMAARDLWDLRSSGPLWNTAFIPRLKDKQRKIKLNGESAGLVDLLQVIQSSLENPFTSYCVNLDSEGDGISARDRECFPNFVSTIGNTITKLELSWKRATGLSVNDLRKIIFDWTPLLTELILKSDDHKMPKRDETIAKSNELLTALPNLKLINVWVTAKESSTGNWLNVAFTQLISEVIESAVGLRKLSLFDDSNSNMKFMRRTITGLLQDKTRSNIHKLMDLTLNSTYSVNLPNATLRDLIQLATEVSKEEANSTAQQLQLQSFAVCVQCWAAPNNEADVRDNLQLLHNFLATQSQTMKELILDFGESHGNKILLTQFQLPRMEKLNKLEFLRPGLGRSEIQFGDGEEFRANFPQLCRFSYRQDPEAIEPGRCTDGLDRLHHPGVTDFSWSLGWGEVDASSDAWRGYSRFCTVFPSLTSLDLKLKLNASKNGAPLNAQEFAKIWTTWPTTLREVGITCSGWDLNFDLDAMVSGISRGRLERLKHEHKALFPGDGEPETTSAQDSLRELLVKFNKAWPGISDLKSLQVLVFIFDDDEEGKKNESDRPQLTDMGGYCGIGMASSTLQRVVIQDIGKNLVSAQCLAFLRKKFGLLAELSL